ncbi:hypothetical protein PsorP6_016582 [Peronosclerospora sorghi]|uniref:Uncharacterized protein n=1 Tax=Peronosclerospora sorghi TaxID=230839 RepID=A0ACC0VJ32_9STRA|nr:hypothetical protein PsorP6_016582 [Peronosclerospora sorghi]
MPPQDGASLRMQTMTTEAGQTFECYLPLLSGSSPETEEAKAGGVSDDKEDKEKIVALDLLAVGRAAAQKISHECIPYEDKETASLYEICVGRSIRRQNLHEMEVQVESTGATTNAERVGGQEVEKVDMFVADFSRPALTYDEFLMPETRDRMNNHDDTLFTQTYGENKHEIQVQFICSASTQDNMVVALQYRHDSSIDGVPDIAAFLIGSKAFCDSDADDNSATVRSLLQPLKDGDTCITRNDGWWTYQLCIGHSLRQYHRDGDGRIVDEFSLGKFDVEGNRELERSGSSLVSEPIEETHDVSRAAYLELYDDGTACDEMESHDVVRKAKVLYYCSQSGSSHHILSVKETQTCTYTVKVSTPVLCNHPHFLNDEKKSEQLPDILHCIPARDGADASVA